MIVFLSNINLIYFFCSKAIMLVFSICIFEVLKVLLTFNNVNNFFQHGMTTE